MPKNDSWTWPELFKGIIDFLTQYPEDEDNLREIINDAFDDCGDLFGTEGQLDPRGDQREQ